MNRIWLTALVTSLSTLACSASSSSTVPHSSESVRVSKSDALPSLKGRGAPESLPEKTQKLAVQRKVGEFSVHRFSGNYRARPLTLTEEVVAIEDGLLVIDYTLEENDTKTKLRVRLDPSDAHIVRVTRPEGDTEVELGLPAYDAMIAKTVFAPDLNDQLLGQQKQTCLVGPKELDCQMKKYRVYVDDQAATLRVTRSNALPNRDIEGEVTALDGTVIYRAELVDLGQHKSEPSVARK